MTVATLTQRAAVLARQRGITSEALIGQYVHRSTLSPSKVGHALSLATATRLLPLIAQVAEPGEIAALECDLPDGPSVVMSQTTYVALVNRGRHGAN